MFSDLIDKYGEDFNWWIPNNMDCFNKQLKQELVKEHKLYGKNLKAIAKCETNDNVLFQSESRIYIIHLLWKKGNKDFPLFIEFIGLNDAINYIEKEYIDKYKN
ncbi:hypothetical protein UT300005_03710 [Clostridium sp. CTA-5]